MIAIRIVEADAAFRMIMRSRYFSEKEVVGPEHMFGLDRETGIAMVLHETGPPARQLLRRGGFAAEHVVLRPAAECGEETRLIADLFAQFLGARECLEDFDRAPAA